MAEFRSPHQQQILPMVRPSTGEVERLMFINNIYRTDDPEIVAKLRGIVAAESASGGNHAITETTELYSAETLNGKMILKFDGFAEETLYAHGETLREVFDRACAILSAQVGQHEVRDAAAKTAEIESFNVVENEPISEEKVTLEKPAKRSTTRRSA